MRLLVSVFFCFLLCNCSKANEPSTYLEQVNAIYKANGSKRISNSVSSSFQSAVSDRDLRMLEQGISGFGEAKKRQELEKKIAEVERTQGSNSIALIPWLMQLYYCPQSVADSALTSRADPGLLERSLNITEAYLQGGKCSPGDASYIARFLTLRPVPGFRVTLDSRRIYESRSSESDKTEELAERMQRAIYKLRLISVGCDGISSLPALCAYLQGRGKGNEGVALYQSSCDFLEKLDAENKQQILLSLYPQYMSALQQIGQPSAAQDIKKKLEVIQAKQYDTQAARAQETLLLARKRAEVDPVGLVENLLSSAQVSLHQKKKTDALALYNEALNAYSSIPPEDDVSDVAESLWATVNLFLASAETKADESILYQLVDAFEKREASVKGRHRAQADIDGAVDRFTELHRTGDAIKFLRYVLEKRRKLRPGDAAAIQDITRRLQSLYSETGDFDKSEEFALDALKSAEMSKDEGVQLRALIDLATTYKAEHKFEGADATITKAVNIVLKSKNSQVVSEHGYALISWLIEDGKLKEAETIVRHAYDIAPSTNNGLPFLQHGVSQLLSAYQHQSKFSEPEALIDFLKNKDPLHANTWMPAENELYLAIARELKKNGKTAEVKAYLGKSKIVFDKQIAEIELRNLDRQYVDRLKKEREATLARFGFASAE